MNNTLEERRNPFQHLPIVSQRSRRLFLRVLQAFQQNPPLPSKGRQNSRLMSFAKKFYSEARLWQRWKVPTVRRVSAILK